MPSLLTTKDDVNGLQLMERQDLVRSICETTADYRLGDLPPPTPDHVERWIQQFDGALQMSVLTEMEYVLRRTYISKEKVASFLRSLMGTENLVGNNPCDFWANVQLLDIQGGGNSQREMNALFESILQDQCGVGSYKGDGEPDTYIYLDDGVFSGNRVRRDIENWIEHAPASCHVHVTCIAIHRGGQYYANKKIEEKIASSGKNIKITWWHNYLLENRRTYANSSDVLWPTVIPNDVAIQRYVDGFRYPLTFRRAGSIGDRKIFSSGVGRSNLEQAFLLYGMRIREMCPNLGDSQRPLGHTSLDSLGFGSLTITFRNCPNNAPLALWAGDPWYPLFPRSTNAEAADRNLFARIMANGF